MLSPEPQYFYPDLSKNVQLTLTGEYAVRLMLHLSSLSQGYDANIASISAEWDIPESFLRKISAQLARAGIIRSTRGQKGGVRLAREARAITLLDVIEAVEGKIFLNKCLICDDACTRAGWCAVHSVWAQAQHSLKTILTTRTLADLAAESIARRNGQPPFSARS
jgi:Rrf2 family protein